MTAIRGQWEIYGGGVQCVARPYIGVVCQASHYNRVLCVASTYPNSQVDDETAYWVTSGGEYVESGGVQVTSGAA